MGQESVRLELPFRGRWRARNSPARKVPSHGSHTFGTTYAIDFLAVDAAGRSAPFRWRTLFSVEPPENFVGFGQPILAPAAGAVVIAHDGEIDHEARRSQLHLPAYALGQASRARQGAGAIAGNHVVIALSDSGSFVLLAHLPEAPWASNRGIGSRSAIPSASAATPGTAHNLTCTFK